VHKKIDFFKKKDSTYYDWILSKNTEGVAFDATPSVFLLKN
jgi:hypothetical protein